MMNFIFWGFQDSAKVKSGLTGFCLIVAFSALLCVCRHADGTFSCSLKIKVSKKNDSRDSVCFDPFHVGQILNQLQSTGQAVAPPNESLEHTIHLANPITSGLSDSWPAPYHFSRSFCSADRRRIVLRHGGWASAVPIRVAEVTCNAGRTSAARRPKGAAVAPCRRCRGGVQGSGEACWEPPGQTPAASSAPPTGIVSGVPQSSALLR